MWWWWLATLCVLKENPSTREKCGPLKNIKIPNFISFCVAMISHA